jgi:hypothetical protein
MSNPIIKEVNAGTGEELEREMTDKEAGEWFIQQQLDEERRTKATMAKEAKEEAILSAKAKLSALGLTVEEITALLTNG